MPVGKTVITNISPRKPWVLVIECKITGDLRARFFEDEGQREEAYNSFRGTQGMSRVIKMNTRGTQ